MVPANFCTLAGISPPEILHWFMEMHVDAYESIISSGTFWSETGNDCGKIRE
jgi:deoxyribodipyrimidine photolyase-like uncharacterized protein